MGKKWRYINHKYVYKPKVMLGRGGNATVYLARTANDTESLDYALKILDTSMNNFREKVERFKIETELVMKMQNNIKGIIPIFDFNFNSDNGDYWYIMPKAISIKEALNESVKIDDKVECIIEISKVLTDLHSKDIVHRDIKPSNIYIYNEKYALSDFGLVDYPDKMDLTRVGEPIGAKATIAPEMKRDSKTADGKKADVYSLAKTLWMLLVGLDYAFDGSYNPDSKIIGLRRYFKDTHLVELEKLLIDSTQDDPFLRPDISVFRKRLEEWLIIFKDDKKSNKSQWKDIQEKLFVQAIPKMASWDDLDDIVKVLNMLGNMPNLNHMFFPSGGGLDLEYAERAGEKGCLLLRAGGFNYIVKPAFLSVENVDKDFEWSYFRLELDRLNPILEANQYSREELTEDLPGNYVSWKYGNYGYYKNGEKLPKGYKNVERFLSGSFVFFSKLSPYNNTSGTYDGRHNKMNTSVFRGYIEKMKEDYVSNEITEFMQEYNKNPFKIEGERNKGIIIEEIKQFKNFVNIEQYKWDFYKICNKNNDGISGNVVYSIEFNINDGDFLKPRKYISSSGRIAEEEDILSFSNTTDNRFLFVNFSSVIGAIKEMEKKIITLCNEKDIKWDENGLYFSIKLHKVNSPKHLFTEEEIEKVLRKGDDSKDNILVIDADGYANLVEYQEYIREKYPVVHETYIAYNNNVGKYSSLTQLKSEYISSLESWLRYLKDGSRQYVDYGSSHKKEEEIIKEILQYY
ncbi:protein kinase domain-containing protein [Terribacillus saccharophilus]|uniref:Protein kinase domain-containing protein n=1 Tax=Terribacillus saccharophilus TaxID=361277 RepID=A0A268AB83_9BACI|nr:protein kinase [Terribacillus saccharophilus]PAD21319.1 hypothetical protein CHH64_09460 [Terribacillus saccharophilus]